jgi:UDP-N-acetyl-D-mannosaminuronate dehydrogenase
LPVDPYYLVQKAAELGYHAQVITAGRAINDSMPFHVLRLIVDALNEQSRAVNGSKIATLGLSCKKDVGDYRESPPNYWSRELRSEGPAFTWLIHIWKRVCSEDLPSPKRHVYEALDSANAFVLVTSHSAFKRLDLRKIKKRCALR